MPDQTTGFRKIKAQELSAQKRQELQKALQHELTEALIRKIQSNPPEIDLGSVKLILKPKQKISDWTVAADCGTCATCNTCSTCNTCATSVASKDLPKSVLRTLGVKENVPQK